MTRALPLLLCLTSSAVAAEHLEFDGALDAFEALGAGGERAEGGRLVLTGTPKQVPGVVTRKRYEGDLEVIVEMAPQRWFGQGYQAQLMVQLWGESYDMNRELGALVSVAHRLNRTLDNSWFHMRGAGAEGVTDAREGRIRSGFIKLRRESGVVRAWYRPDDGPWEPLAGDAGPVALPLSGPVRVALRVDPAWVPEYRIEVERLEVRADADRDGLLDDEEALVGTDPLRADSDGDGRRDGEDLRPLRAGAEPRMEVVDGVQVRTFVARDGRLLVVAENPEPEKAPLTLSLAGLPAGEAVERVFEGGSVTSADGLLADVLPPYARRVYRLPAFDLPPMVDAAFRQVVRPASEAPVELDLTPYASSPDGEPVTWSIGGARGPVRAELKGNTLVLRPRGGGCGVGTVNLAVDAGGRKNTHDLEVRFTGAPGPELLGNGGFEDGLVKWTTYIWEGEARLDAVDAGVRGKGAMLIEGAGAGKAGVFQKIELRPGTYRLGAAVASRGLAVGKWGQAASLHIDLKQGDDVDLQIPAGDHDWRRAEAVFEVKKATEAHVYAFGWGAGAFLVDDLSVRRVEKCAGPLKAGRGVSAERLGPLKYAAPITADDLLLCGYCADPAFAKRPMCETCARGGALVPRRADEPEILAGGDADWGMFPGAPLDDDAAVLRPGRFMAADPVSGLPTDWRGHDWLRVDLHNPNPTAQPVYIEIRDGRTQGYWTRVNWYTTAVPGESSVRVPVQVFVGEKSVIRERRRLDIEDVTRLVLSVTGDQPVKVRTVALEPEPPYRADSPRILKLDAGPRSGPVFPGFTRLLPTTRYDRRRGYGWAKGTEVLRVDDRRHPDDLLRDWISVARGGLDLELPNGRYHVWMMLEDPGYWEYYPNYERRTVRAEGALVVDDRLDAATFWRRYWRHADTEDLPGDDIWNRYVKSRYVPQRFVVDVEDGRLQLRLTGTTYAATLSALVVYPDAERDTGDAFVDALWERLKTHFRRAHVEQRGAPTRVAPPTEALAFYQRSPAEDFRADERPAPEERVERLELALAKGERAPLTVTLYGKQDHVLTGARLDLPSLKVEPRVVRYKLTRVTADGAVYENAPRLLDPLDGEVSVKAGVPRRLWFVVDAPRDAVAGVREANLELSFADGATRSLPVRVTVRPFVLPEPDLLVGYLGMVPQLPATVYDDDDPAARMADAVALLDRWGFTALAGGLGGPRFTGYADGEVQVDFDRADATMALAKSVSDAPLNSYNGFEIAGLPLHRTADTRAEHQKPFTAVLRDVMKKVRAHAAARGWLPVHYVVGDEPAGERIEQSVELARALKKAAPKLETAVFTSATKTGDETMKLAGPVDVLIMQLHSEAVLRKVRAAGSRFALYNLPDRYHRGVYLWRLKPLGVLGYYQFAFSSVGADPYYALDAREDDLVGAFTHPSGQLVPALDLARFAYAVDDLRYLQALDAAIAEAPRGDARRAAVAFRDGLRDKMTVGSDAKAPWSPGELDAVRADAARHIEALGR